MKALCSALDHAVCQKLHYAGALLFCLCLSACARESSDASKPSTATSDKSGPVQARGEPVGLLIQGYNYTDDYINSFTVNGAGGGNLLVSGPESGGGKSVCCFSYQPGEPLPIKLRVRWTATYCLYSETSPYGRTSEHRQGVWKESEAFVTEPPSGKPRALEVHFYKDGHVEAAITEGNSPPRLKLPRNENYYRPGVIHHYEQCTDEQRQRTP